MKVTPGWPTSLIASAIGTVSIWLLASSTICCTVFLILSGIGFLRCLFVLSDRTGGSPSTPLQDVRAGRFRTPRTKFRIATSPLRGSRRAAARPADRRRSGRCARRSASARIRPIPPSCRRRGRAAAAPTRSAFSSSLSSAMKARSSFCVRIVGCSPPAPIAMPSSVAFEPESGSVTTSWTSNSRALTMMKQTFSDEMDSVGSAIAHPPSMGTDVPTRTAVRSRAGL